jgi:hypothetical protein
MALITQAIQLAMRNVSTNVAVIVRQLGAAPGVSNVEDAVAIANETLEEPRMYLHKLHIPGGFRWRLTNGSTVALFSAYRCTANFPGARFNAAYFYDDVSPQVRNAWEGHIFPREPDTKLGAMMRRASFDALPDSKGRRGQ